MSLQFIGSATGSAINGGNASINVGGISGIAKGDLLLVMSGTYDRSTGAALATTNGTGSFSEPTNVAANNTRGRFAWKFVNGDTTVTLAGTANSADSVAGVAFVFRRANGNSPMDAVPVSITGTGTAPNAASITRVYPQSMVVAFGIGLYDTSVGTPTSFSTPVLASAASETNRYTAAACYLTTTTPGATDPAAFGSWTTTSNNWVAITIAIRSTPMAANLASGAPTLGAPLLSTPSNEDAWNHSRFDAAAYTLADDDRSATLTGAAERAIISTTSHASGKYFASLVALGTGTPDCDFGLWDGVGVNGGSGHYPAKGIWCSVDGQVGTVGGGTLATVDARVAGDIIDIALDVDAEELWLRVNGGNWNASGSANPATGVGGIDISSVALASIFLYVSTATTGSGFTINTGTAAFTYPAPAGFSNWYGSPPSTWEIFLPSLPMDFADENLGSMRVICTLDHNSVGAIAVTFLCIPNNGHVGSEVQHMSFGKWDGNVSSADTTAAPIELKFGGSSGFDLSSYTADGVPVSITSDYIDHPGLSLLTGDSIVVIFDTNPTNSLHNAQVHNGYGSNAITWYGAGESWNVKNITPGDWTNLLDRSFCIDEIDSQAPSGGGSITANSLVAGAPTLGTPAFKQIHKLAGAALAAGAPTLSSGLTHPNFVSATPTAGFAFSGSATSPSIAVLNGDILVAHGFLENDAPSSFTIATASGSTSIWTARQEPWVINSGNDRGYMQTATAVATANGNITVSFTEEGVQYLGGIVKVWRNSGGIGNSNAVNNGLDTDSAPTVNVTTAQDNSALEFADTDWNARTGTATFTSSTGSPVSDLVDQSGGGSSYCNYSSHLLDAGVVGSKTMGMSAPSTQQYACTILEVKGSGSAGPVLTVAEGGGSITITAIALAAGTPALGTFTLKQIHKLTAAALAAGAPTLGTPVLVQLAGVVNLTAVALAAGVPTLSAPAISQKHILGSVALAAGAPTLGAPAIKQQHILGAVALAAGAPTLATPAIKQTHVLSAAALVAGSATLGTPALVQLAGVVNLTAAALAAGAPTFGTPAIHQAHALVPVTLIAGAPTFATPALGIIVNLSAASLTAGAPILGAPGLVGRVALVASALTTGNPTVGAPNFAQQHRLGTAAITTGPPTLGTPILKATSILSAAALMDGAPTLGSAAFAQKHFLQVGMLLDGAPTLGAPVIGIVGLMSCAPLSAGAPVLGTPTFRQTHKLVPAALLDGAPILGTPALIRRLPLTAAALTAGVPTLGSPAIGQTHVLQPAALLDAAPTVPAITLGIVGLMGCAPLVSGAPVLGAPAFRQTHRLAGSALLDDGPTLGAPSLNRGIVVVAANLTDGAPTVGAPAIKQTHRLQAAALVAGSPVLGPAQPVLNGAVAAANLAAGKPTLGTPVLHEGYHPASANLQSGAPVLGTPTIGQTHVFAALSLRAGDPVLDASEMLVGIWLQAADLITGAPIIGIAPFDKQLHWNRRTHLYGQDWVVGQMHGTVNHSVDLHGQDVAVGQMQGQVGRKADLHGQLADHKTLEGG